MKAKALGSCVAMLAACGGSNSSQIARGKYLVEVQADCANCHTPKDANGVELPGMYLAGGVALKTVDAPVGTVIHSSNITSDATGLKSWTDAQIKNAVANGIRNDGTPLYSSMNYWEFHNLSDADLDAIVAYLRTVPPVQNTIVNATRPTASAPRPLLSIDLLPHTTLPASDAAYASAERGRAIAATTCVGCHTPNDSDQSHPPRDATKLFAGNRTFSVNPGSTSSTRSTRGTSRRARTASRAGRWRSSSRRSGPAPTAFPWKRGRGASTARCRIRT